MNLKDKILNRAIEQFLDVTEINVVSRHYPNSTEREAGAFLWGIRDRNIGCCFTMAVCLKAKNWRIIDGEHYREIVPED